MTGPGQAARWRRRRQWPARQPCRHEVLVDARQRPADGHSGEGADGLDLRGGDHHHLDGAHRGRGLKATTETSRAASGGAAAAYRARRRDDVGRSVPAAGTGLRRGQPGPDRRTPARGGRRSDPTRRPDWSGRTRGTLGTRGPRTHRRPRARRISGPIIVTSPAPTVSTRSPAETTSATAWPPRTRTAPRGRPRRDRRSHGVGHQGGGHPWHGVLARAVDLHEQHHVGRREGLRERDREVPGT